MNNISFLHGSPGFDGSFSEKVAAYIPVVIVGEAALRALQNINHSFSWETLRCASYAFSAVVTHLTFQTLHLVFPIVPYPAPVLIVTGAIAICVVPILALKIKEFWASRGNPQSQVDLGLMLEEGRWGLRGLPALRQRVVEMYARAADQNHAEAQFRLGNCYELGIGVAVNKHIAVQYYTQAADQDYAEAQNRLGVCYENGNGVDANLETAIAWYRRAAALNNADARNHLIRLNVVE